MQIAGDILLLLLVAVTSVAAVSVCPGEGGRYGDHKCDHDRTHRVCAQLVEDVDTCQEVKYPVGSSQRTFWEITGQQRWNWKETICSAPNPGTSWCICMWASANLAAEVGCDNFKIDCGATDVDFVLRSSRDGNWDMENFHTCLRTKCQKQEDGSWVNKP